MTCLASQRRWLSQTAVRSLGLTATIGALVPQLVIAGPRPIQQSNWPGSVQDYPARRINGHQAYANPPLTAQQQAQRCNTGRLIGGLGGGAVAYAMSRDDGRAWAIPLGALLGSQVGCNAAAGRGPLPW